MKPFWAQKRPNLTLSRNCHLSVKNCEEKLAHKIVKDAPGTYGKTSKSPRDTGNDDGTGNDLQRNSFHHFEVESLPSNSAGLDLAVYQR